MQGSTTKKINIFETISIQSVTLEYEVRIRLLHPFVAKTITVLDGTLVVRLLFITI